MRVAKNREGTDIDPFTEDGFAELQTLIGKEKELVSDHNREVTRDNIRRFALGSGDDNPIWIDGEYAKRSRWKGIIAPPCFMRTLGEPLPESLPDVHSQFVGEEFRLEQPIRLNDDIKATFYLSDIIKKASRLYGQILLEYKESKYTNQRKEVFHYRRTYMRHHRLEGETAPSTVKPAYWKPDEIIKFEESRLNEERRGATPRYWEEVTVGEELPVRIRGPLTLEDIIWHLIGEGGSNWAYGIGMSYKLKQADPAVYLVNSQGAWETASAAHWDWEVAKRIGAAGPYDILGMRSTSICNMLTDWAGDDGWIKRLSVETRGFMILGDVVFYKGKVTGKYRNGQEGIVKLEISGDNQRNERTTNAQAEVQLPVKAG